MDHAEPGSRARAPRTEGTWADVAAEALEGGGGDMGLESPGRQVSVSGILFSLWFGLIVLFYLLLPLLQSLTFLRATQVSVAPEFPHPGSCGPHL